MNSLNKTFLILGSLFFIFYISIKGLGDAFTPLIISFGLSYLLFPLIKKLETKGINRNIAVSSVFTLFILAVILSLALMIPNLITDGKAFIKELPQNSAKAIDKVELLANNLGYDINLSKDSISLYLQEHVSDFSGEMLKNIGKGLKLSFSGISQWLLSILNLFLIPLFFFYVITDYESLSKEINSFIPRSFLSKSSHYAKLCNEVLSGYIRGQLLVVLALSALYSIGLSVVGLKFGFLIGLLAGLISIIPYAGFTLGFVAAITMALSNYSGPGILLGIIIVFVIVQILEGFIITPKLVGNKVGLSAFATLLSLIVGGNLFGLIGMIIAIPSTAILKAVFSDLKKEYQKLDFYKAT